MSSTDLVGNYTIMDVINDYTSLDSKAEYIWAAKVLAKKCPFIQDMPMIASNQIMSNIGSRESYIPTPGTRRFNEGVSLTASHSTPFTTECTTAKIKGQVLCSRIVRLSVRQHLHTRESV